MVSYHVLSHIVRGRYYYFFHVILLIIVIFFLVIISVLLGKNTLKNGRHHEELLQIFAASVKKIFQVTTKLYVWPVNWCQRLNLKVWRDFKECVDLSLLLGNKDLF